MTDSLPKQQISKQPRAPAPMLSPQHLALARSLPHSQASTPTPSLLTPPVSGTPNMSPPPRHEADDYMNFRVPKYHHHKRKHPRRKSRKLYNTREGSEGSRPPQRLLRSGPQTASSNASECELCATGISDGDDDSGSSAPLIRSSVRPNLRNDIHEPQNTIKVDRVHVQTWPTTLSSSVIAADEADSPAANALLSLSLKVPIRSNPQGLRRVSTALANTLGIFKPKPAVSFAAVPSHNASKKAEEASRRSSAHSKSLAYRDTNRRRPVSEDGKDGKDGKDVFRTLGTPATITLRKASNVFATSPITTSMGVSMTREAEYKRVADAPASELLAFYSSLTLEKSPTLTDLPSPESAEAPRSLMEPPTFTFEMKAQSVRRGSKSVSQLSDNSDTRRCSMPAEAALTFADVHVAPGSFTVGPKSRNQSLVPKEFSRRISTVQFWSRNSVHEVIWREDETKSDSSLTASSRASQHGAHSFRSTPTPESEGSPTQVPAIEPKEPRESQAVLPKVSDSLSMFTNMPDNLFRWTWGRPSASAEGTPRATDPKSNPLEHVVEATARAADTKGDPLSQVLVTSTSDPGFASLRESSDQQGSRSHKPSFAKLPSVLSFPPLRPRSSTAEWRKEPLVDLNDPLAGRVTQYQFHMSTPSTEQATGVESSTAGSQERGSSQLHDTAVGRRWSSSPHVSSRLATVGSVGSGIGASSHKRVLSRHKF